jgi:hypothetical protein
MKDPDRPSSQVPDPVGMHSLFRPMEHELVEEDRQQMIDGRVQI